MVCEKVGSTVKAMQIRETINVFDLKRRGSDRSVFDIKVPQEHFESIRNRLYGALMLYTDLSAHKAKIEIF